MCLKKGWPMVVLCSGKQYIVVDEQNDHPRHLEGLHSIHLQVRLVWVPFVLMLPVPETKVNFRKVFFKFLGFNLVSIWKKLAFNALPKLTFEKN
jgi:hypothetical protein